DVVATGSSLAATFALARSAGAEIVGAGVILTEGHDWKKTLGADAGLIHGLGHIPQFSLADGKATPMPETLASGSWPFRKNRFARLRAPVRLASPVFAA